MLELRFQASELLFAFHFIVTAFIIEVTQINLFVFRQQNDEEAFHGACRQGVLSADTVGEQ